MKCILRPAWGITPALLLVLICGFCRPANASIVYVNKNALGAVHDGTTWATAFTAVQPAVDASKSGDEVWVAAGTYVENITLAANASVYGGFTGSETQRSQRDTMANIAVLDGSRHGSVVIVSNSVSELATLDGFTIRNGYESTWGGGVTVSGNALISHNTIEDSAGTEGGGICVGFGTATVEYNLVRRNIGIYGGGICVFGGSAVIRNNSIARNSAGGFYGHGGGICISSAYGTTTIANNAINSNDGGGGIYTGGQATIVNNTITGSCSASGSTISGAGGIEVVGGRATIGNTISAFNSYGVIVTGGTVTLRNNDAYGNSLSDYALDPNPIGTAGNISKDPRLSAPYKAARLKPDSPCIDAGDDSLVTPGGTDVNAKPRIIGPHVDIGADESDGTAWTEHTAVVYVSKAGDDVNDGTTWSRAKQTVGAAFDIAQGGDEVWVAKGIYRENPVVPSGVALYGGFLGTEAALSERDAQSNSTALDGSQTGSTLTLSQGTVVDGWTILNGRDSGIYVIGSSVITNDTIEGNGQYSNRYGGIEVLGSATIDRNTISDNSAGYGGGIHISGGGATITRNIIRNNTSYWEGGGISDSGAGTVTIADNIIFGNSASYGGAIFVGNYIKEASIVGNTLVGNCAYGGGGVAAYGGAVHVCNTIIASNSSGVFLPDYHTGTFALSSSDVSGNTAYNFRGLTDATGTFGDISQDPLFVDAGSGDYHLRLASPCRDAGDDSVVAPGETDMDGRPRIIGKHVDMGAYELQARPVGWTVSLGSSVAGGVTVAEKVAYVAGNDGKLYARSTEDGSAVAGFPVDISAVVGATVKLPSRPAVYYGKTGKAIYLTTDRGDVVRVLPTGLVAWHVRPLTGQTVSTPAVTPDGNVYVSLSTGSGPFDNFVFKLDEATGTPLSLSPFLGYTTADNIGDFSPAANSRYLYVNSGWGSKSGLTLLNQDNLAVRSSFAGGEQCLSPLLLGSDLLLASKGGKAWKMNAVTLAPDLGFGHFGVADLEAPISAAPFSDAAGNVYIGTADGRILKWAPGSGSFVPFYSATGKIAGLTIDRTAGVLGFGTSNGAFVQVPLSDPASATTVTPGGPISTGTVYEALTDRFIVVTDTGILSGYPAVR